MFIADLYKTIHGKKMNPGTRGIQGVQGVQGGYTGPGGEGGGAAARGTWLTWHDDQGDDLGHHTKSGPTMT